MLKKLCAIWQKRGLDIRQTRNGRWLDQKVTPDVLSAICDVISGFLDGRAQSFTIKDLWHSDELVRVAEQDFGKPHPQNPKARSEYKKFIGQPLKALAAAHILDAEGKNPIRFSIAQNMGDVIHQMADSERKAIEFLDGYISETLHQSGMGSAFDNFLSEKQTPESFSRLKDNYAGFIINNTPINTPCECHRIFSKALNILAYSRQKKGSDHGRLSKVAIGLNDIRYNRLNTRDIATGKPKHVPRQSYKLLRHQPLTGDAWSDSRVDRRVIHDVKQHHKFQPEIEDRFSGTPGAVEGHHIFPKSDYPQLSRLRENIILLTPTQHRGHAHAEGVHAVSEYYQHFCLQKKLEAVKQCEKSPNCNFYSFHTFKKMLLAADIIGDSDAKHLASLDFDDVSRMMHKHYGPKQQK